MGVFKNIALAVSGGVDSAVTGIILKNKGYNLVGVFMRNWDEMDNFGDAHCTNSKDAEDAAWTCSKLGIEFKEVSFVKEYWTHVFQEMVKDYQSALTPNPDILCNSHIKFSYFYDYCMQNLNVDAIATGHYARTPYGPFLENNTDDPPRLLKAKDTMKDQTYFLSKISANVLRRTMFPVGDYLKKEVKAIAYDNSFHKILDKKESTGICFIGKKKFSKFIKEYIPDKVGDFIDIDTGNIVGKHNGVHYWTIGQRCVTIKSKMYYVAKMSKESENIYVAAGHDHPALYFDSLFLNDIHWINEKPSFLTEHKHIHCEFRSMHRMPLRKCTLLQLEDNTLVLHPEEPLYTSAPGQYAVFYYGDECLGSGKIYYAGPSLYSINCDITTNPNIKVEAKEKTK